MPKDAPLPDEAPTRTHAPVRGQKRNTQPGHPGFLADARLERPGEKIGGGFWVFRRSGEAGRIRTPEWPFEHPSLASAATERDRLAARHPKESFVVVSVRPDAGAPA